MSIKTDPTISVTKKLLLTITNSLILADLADAGDFYGRGKKRLALAERSE